MSIFKCFFIFLHTRVVSIVVLHLRLIKKCANNKFYGENPGTSIRPVARALIRIPRSTVHRVLQQNGLHPFHYQRVQRDKAQRIYFCEGIFIF